jgi:hypothetical protein
MTAEPLQIKDRRNQPFCIVETPVLTDESLLTHDKMVYVVLCSFASARNHECFPSVSTIAKRASCGERQVRKSLKTLESRGYIGRDFVRGHATVYTILDLTDRAAHSAGGQDTPAPHAGEDGTTCRGPRHTVPPNNNALTKEQDTQPAVEASPEQPDLETEAYLHESPPSESEAKLLDVQEAPPAMRQTASYLLLHTGRSGLLEEEISVLRAFNASHFPARVQKEVDVAVERFKRMGRDPKTLTFLYIADAMRHRKPTRSPTGRSSPANMSPAGSLDESESLNI